MTKREQARRSAIIAELSRLSRDGWQGAKPYDYAPLEAELRALNTKLGSMTMILDQMLESLEHHAHHVLLKAGQKELTPLYHIHPAEGPDYVVGCPWRDETEKLLTIELIRDKAHEVKATAIGFIGEMWMAQFERDADLDNADPPSQQPNRIEVVMAMVTDNRDTKTKAWRIIRSKSGRITRLEPTTDGCMGVGGRLIDGLLPGRVVN